MPTAFFYAPISGLFYCLFMGVMVLGRAECPLCGARSSWINIWDTGLWKKRIPDKCHFCKREDYIHTKQWIQGIDVTEHGGGHIWGGAGSEPDE